MSHFPRTGQAAAKRRMEKEEEGGGRGVGEPRKRLGATVKSQVEYVYACV